MSFVRRCRKLLFLLTLVGCNGDAPILTCQKPCASSNEYRDLFCVCQKKDPPSGTGWHPGPTITPGVPYLDFAWEEQYGCHLNRRYYLLNSDSKELLVKVSRKIANSWNRTVSEYRVAARATRREDGVDLGFEELGSECFDQDFTITTWRSTTTASGEAYAYSKLNESIPELVAEHHAQIESLQTVRLASIGKRTATVPLASFSNVTLHREPALSQSFSAIKSIDCAAACNANDGALCPLRGFPPDQEKLAATRDRLRQSPSGVEYRAADIYSIFGLSKQSCERSDIPKIATKIMNNGKYCALPVHLRETDNAAKAALHLPTSIKGDRITRGVLSSGVAFGAGTGQPLLLFNDADLQNDFGGAVLEATASDKGVYYQTSGGCIFLGVK
jgi:hypothetical protein